MAVIVGALFQPGNAHGATADDLAEALRFRRDFGMSTDLGYVQSLLNNPIASIEFGTPLSDDELIEMHQRLALQDALQPVAAYIDANPDSFGGFALNQADGGTVEVMVVDGGLTDTRNLLDLMPAGAAIRFHAATFSTKELNRAQSEVEAALPELQQAGVAIVSVGIDVMSNQLVVVVEDASTVVVAALTDGFGSAIRVEASGPLSFLACNNRLDCGAPMKGGLGINSNNGLGCSSGFLGRTVSGGPTYRYVLTAGHCLDATYGSGLGATWNHPSTPNTPLGTGNFERLYNGTSADVGGINDSESGSKNKVYGSSNSNILSVTSQRTNSQQYVGVTICRYGRTSGYDCGVIVQTNTTVVVEGITLYHQWQASMASGGGDSGAPLLCGGACGILSAGPEGAPPTTYGTIDWIVSEAGVRPCYTASCA